MRAKEKELGKVRRLVGRITKKQMRYVDSFVADDVGLFMPVGGACFYALTPEHTHPAYMFILHFNEQTAVKLDGRIRAAQSGKMFALSPEIAHQELPSDSPPRYIAILIERKFFENQIRQYPVNEKIFLRGEFYDANDTLLPLLKRFMIETDNKVAGSEAVLYGLSLEICHSIIRSILDLKPVNDRISSRIEIDRVIEHIHAVLGEKITIEKMAKIACMSPSHFSRIFKQETGISPMDYLNRIRMDRAKKLLLAGDKSITEIAIECGFGSSSYLSACFYKRFKISPSLYCKKDRISKKKNSILKALSR
ncbi:MAG: helix-turn-helix transcriptional regulator [Nitrospirae bacterium]|nr:helix-turn-helix transcriptional regulator [Nitrospirota bacterium]